jgi:hypothetical protein
MAKLFKLRISGLRSSIWPSRGGRPRVTRERIRLTIGKLQDIAEQSILNSKQASHIFALHDYKKQWHPKRGKGFGRSEKARSFKRWYEDRISTRNCVYVFWQNNRCLYVGRTLNGKGRPTSHFEKHWFGRATRVDVYGFERKRDVPRYECMFTHYHWPAYSRMKPASKKYYSRCPICDARKDIRSEVQRLFRLR